MTASPDPRAAADQTAADASTAGVDASPACDDAAEIYRQTVHRLYVRLLLGQSGCDGAAWHDPSDHPVLAPFAEGAPEIVEEGRRVLARFEALVAAHPERYTPRHPGLIGQRASFYLNIAGLTVARNRALCPHTAALIDGAAQITNAAFYLLGPRSHILPHRGICDGLLRAHLGVVCPSAATLTVNGEARAWSEGRLLVFDDRHEHEARNDSDDWRCILLFDFMPSARVDAREQALITAQQRMQIIKRIDFEGYHAAGLAGDDALARQLAAASERARTADPQAFATLAAIIAENGFYTI